MDDTLEVLKDIARMIGDRLDRLDGRLNRIEARLPAPKQGPLTEAESERLFDVYEAMAAGQPILEEDELQDALKASEDVER